VHTLPTEKEVIQLTVLLQATDYKPNFKQEAKLSLG